MQGDDLGCPGASAAGVNYVLDTAVLTKEADTWVARARSAAGGAYEIRFTRDPAVPAAPVGPVALVGHAAGAVQSTEAFPFGSVRDASVDLGDAAAVSLEGTMASTGFFASGPATGHIVFRNSAGAAIACAGRVFWSLARR